MKDKKHKKQGKHPYFSPNKHLEIKYKKILNLLLNQ
jgi:hypothetical protein